MDEIQSCLTRINQHALDIIHLEKTNVAEYKKQISLFYENFTDSDIQEAFELVLARTRANVDSKNREALS